MIRAIVFDVGYTLIDEARHWSSWARELAVPTGVFMSALGAVIAERRHHREVFGRLRPDFDLNAALLRRDASDDPYWREEDLYPDARASLASLNAHGIQIGLAGNQPPKAKKALEALNLQVDWIANSAELGVEKPSPLFFTKLAEKVGMRPSEIAYVGDRLDNDILPAQRAGMFGVFLRRGPWGEVHSRWPEAAQANLKIASLLDLDRF